MCREAVLKANVLLAGALGDRGTGQVQVRGLLDREEGGQVRPGVFLWEPDQLRPCGSLSSLALSTHMCGDFGPERLANA